MIKRAKRRVVIIDDNEMIRLTLRALLRAIELGVDGIIVKPFRQKQIHDEICRVIQCPDQRD